jgi:hypothetical protein
VAEVKRRLMFIQSVETVRCIEEGVVTAAIDADVGAILGWGFPPFLGGPIGQIHSRGIAAFVGDCEQLAVLHVAEALLSRSRPTGRQITLSRSTRNGIEPCHLPDLANSLEEVLTVAQTRSS